MIGVLEMGVHGGLVGDLAVSGLPMERRGDPPRRGREEKGERPSTLVYNYAVGLGWGFEGQAGPGASRAPLSP